MKPEEEEEEENIFCEGCSAPIDSRCNCVECRACGARFDPTPFAGLDPNNEEWPFDPAVCPDCPEEP